MSNKKKLKDLTIRDNFMFAAVMMQGDNCLHFLEMVLGIEIQQIEVSYEKSIIIAIWIWNFWREVQGMTRYHEVM